MNIKFEIGQIVKYKEPLNEKEKNSLFVVVEQGYKEDDERFAYTNIKDIKMAIIPYNVGLKADFETI